MNNNDSKALLTEMQALKRLLVLQLMTQGVKQRQIAGFLGISEATMSRMLPKGALKPSSRRVEDKNSEIGGN
jgi:predicted transcriptional regulator|tara:strand:- start:160 stop:375 length:216 start_codon:yes stop_codon:yes gene_type:complete